MPELGGFQLLPQTKKELGLKESSKGSFVGVSAAVAVGLSILFLGGTFYATSLGKKLNSTIQNITDLESQRDSAAEKRLLVLSKQAKQTSTALSGHNIWTKALDSFARLLQPQIQVKNLSGSLESTTLDFGGAALNYTAIAKQIAAFRDYPGITDVTLSGVHTTDAGRIEFSMKVIFDPAKFIRNE